MKGRHSSRKVSKRRPSEVEENEKIIGAKSYKLTTGIKEKQEIGQPVYDVLLESVELSKLRIDLIKTDVNQIIVARRDVPIFDIFVTGSRPEERSQMPSTDLAQVHPPLQDFVIADMNLLSLMPERLSPILSTEMQRRNVGITMSEASASLFDPNLNHNLNKFELDEIIRLNTELVDIPQIVELRAASDGESQMPVFEGFINCDGRLPRSFSESSNAPLVVLLGEDEKEWHIPIIYSLKELFCEITDRYPKITFREPEFFEEGVEEVVDSLDPHSLDQFTLEHKIEFLDARRMHVAVDEFAKMVRGRLKSGFLQQFGVLVVAVRSKDLQQAENALKIAGLRVYKCTPNDDRYEAFCSKILGLNSPGQFFDGLKRYEKHLAYTLRHFSPFVKRAKDASDRLQYPLKVATFVYLLNELRARKRRIINNFEDMCEFVNEVLGNEIKVEEQIKINGDSITPDRESIIPDLVFSPHGEKIYVEIETLAGTFEPLKKIDETIEKYIKEPKAKIWLVLKPVSALIHYEELKARKRAYEILYKDKEINFKVLKLTTFGDKFKWQLEDINEFLRNKNDK